ncbi:helix-turn-helix transcriptional regulator [Gaetbulibacter jejuensis]|uniref:helix-turn-helix domain-containing protein n=1 Tax=Gaetbulibacter jejuensis TaxID=584607 RepID=UPI003009CF82
MQFNETHFVKAFGKHLRALRKAQHLSQEHLANDADIPINQIGRIERGEISTTIGTVFLIAKALNLPVKELFNFEKN